MDNKAYRYINDLLDKKKPNIWGKKEKASYLLQCETRYQANDGLIFDSNKDKCDDRKENAKLKVACNWTRSCWKTIWEIWQQVVKESL